MGTRPNPRFVLAALLLVALTSVAAFGANCPIVADSTVIVSAGTPTAFSLDVRNLDGAQVSVLSYPLGGALASNGSGGRSFIFSPNADYSGITYAQFRLTQPAGCIDDPKIIVVTFVVAGADTTNLNVSGGLGIRPVVCGVDFIPIVIPALGLMAASVHRRCRRLQR